MIDTKKLRRLAQEATSGEWVVHWNHIYGRKKVTDGEEEWHPFIACTDDDEVNVNFVANASFIAAANPAAISELLDRLEAAEKDVALKEQIIDALGSELNAVANERDALRAKIAEMGKQRPAAWCATDETGTVVEALGMNQSRRFDTALYLALGAQPAPSVPDGWLPVPEKHPTFDPVDLQLSDGSVLCGCIPQVDGDYWWEGPSGEVFIDPKYASVTHWRLAAVPEAKP